MYKNYWKIALRTLWRNKFFSAINIIGLAAGLAVCLLITLYVTDECGYDRYNENADRIYRLDADLFMNGTLFNSATSPNPMPGTLAKDYPMIEQFVRLSFEYDILVRKGNQNIQEHHSVLADSTFFKVFTAPMIAGDPLTALNEPNSVVIDETTARRYFNSTDVIGKTLYIDNAENCKITGVIKDFPRQSHFHFSFIRPFHEIWPGQGSDWLTNGIHSYILVKPGVKQSDIQSRVDETVNTYLSKQLEGAFHSSIHDLQGRGDYFRYHLMPLTDIHLHSDKTFEFEANGNINYVYIFSVIAIVILIIACVNFMNLSTSRSANRAKEVGIRKVSGSTRNNLIMQFLVESVLMSYLALLLALALSSLLIPLFNQVSGKQMHVDILFTSWLLPTLITLAFVVGCAAGSYPAFYLSSFNPIRVLKGSIASGFKHGWLRSSLVVFQFSTSIILIIGTIVIYNQLGYIRSRKIGYDREHVLVLHNTENLDKRIHTFREELLSLPGVEQASISADLPTVGGGNLNQRGWFRDPTLNAQNVIIMTSIYVDENYIPALGMHIENGRNFSTEYKTDSTGLILNETAAKMLGWRDLSGAKLYLPGDSNKPKAFHVIGIVKDFNFSSMHDKIGPMVMRLEQSWGNIVLRFKNNDIPSLISQIQDKWNSMAPGLPLSYTFMDNDFNNLYNAEQQTGKLFTTFAVFAIFIACLGLFGLITYAAEQRTKEIGIRKVLGASVGRIVSLLSKEFVRLVCIASLIGFPVAWWAMNKWLESFAYRVNIGWWVFVIAGLATLMSALITVSLQAIKAAMANPVKSLKTE
ncbi:ABC transporter permease [Dinghuibacter silviterrae]|nr:FtsX-like permease family protein [Dinghuibacter silviterrae]